MIPLFLINLLIRLIKLLKRYATLTQNLLNLIIMLIYPMIVCIFIG